MTEPEALRAHAERIKASGVLGRSPLMQRLFDFLLACSMAGKAPKEIEVAVDAFGKGAEFDVSQDAMVRVYIHKLRRKLEEFYAGPGSAEAVRLSIPKGEYRFVVEAAAVPAVEEDLSALASVEPPPARRRWILPVLGASAVVNMVLLAVFFLRPSAPVDDFREVRENPVWAPILKDDRLIFVVVGDYYIFGETDDSMNVTRMIREFAINSHRELEEYAENHPEVADKYMDLGLTYLPTSVAPALRELMPILDVAGKRVRVVLASEMTPDLLTRADIVYVGYLSGMGMLRRIVFAGSQFAIGETYDELIDRKSGRHYISQSSSLWRGDPSARDYGYFSTFAGSNGNRVIVIAGTRDVALANTAEAAAHPDAMDRLTQQAGDHRDFEALYEVYGMEGTNVDSKLLTTVPLNTAAIWRN